LEYEADFIVLGAGSLGVSIAYLLGALSNSRIILVEREREPAEHYSGRNEGIVHRPFFLPPKVADLTAASWNFSYQSWKEASLIISGEWKVRGMIYLAIKDNQITQLEEYKSWGLYHGMQEEELNIITGEEINRLEPEVKPLIALYSKTEANIDYKKIITGIADVAKREGIRVNYDCNANIVKNTMDYVMINCGHDTVKAKYLINAAGGNALKILNSIINNKEFTEIYAGGIYYKLKKNFIKNHNVYTIPTNLKFPFTDPHIILRPDGTNVVGPLPFIVYGPYNYRDGMTEFLKSAIGYWLKGTFKGYKIFGDNDLKKMISDNWKILVFKNELINKISYFVPNITQETIGAEDFRGIRHILVDKNGLVGGPVIKFFNNQAHILNYDGPGATGAPAFAMMFVNELQKMGILSIRDFELPLWNNMKKTLTKSLSDYHDNGIKIFTEYNKN